MNGRLTIEDFDLDLTNASGVVQRLPNDAQGLSWESNTEVIDWWPTSSQLGQTFYLNKRNAAPNMASQETERMVVAWGWVKDKVQPLVLDIGSPGTAGTFRDNKGTLTVSGGGADIWGTSDQFFFGHQILNGDGTINVKLNSMTNPNSSAKAGIMIRESLAANSRYAGLFVTPTNGIQFQRRTSTGGTTSANIVTGASPRYLRLKRTGDTFTASASTDGVNYTNVGSIVISGFSSFTRAGLGVTAHNNASSCSAVFQSLRVVPGNLN
jgi:hypothetical protein